MTYRLKIANTGEELFSDGSISLLQSLRISSHAPEAACGGLSKCGKCSVIVSGACAMADGSEKLLSGEQVLSCRVFPRSDMEITLPDRAKAAVRTDMRTIPGGGEGLGLAADIGTTTIAVYLYDLSSGQCIAQCGEQNAQCAYGADVISRIRHAETTKGLATLSGLVRSQISEMAKKLCDDMSRISYVSIAGNTIMEHLFAGLDPAAIGISPYIPQHFFGEELLACDYLEGFPCDVPLYLSPAISGFVGGDISAGLLAAGAFSSDETVLYIDVGTNGEMALGNKQGYLCCSSAAGPAFEGGEIECGSPARLGAINAVDDDLSYSVIGGGDAQSICGSGLIDAVAVMLKNDIIDFSGRLENGRYEFGNNVFITSSDVRALQLAKAAIRAGIETLLTLSDKKAEDIDRVLIAGGFGAALNVKSACDIGMLPPELLKKAQSVGNCSGLGAALALGKDARAQLSDVRELCRYVELGESELFGEKYFAAMMFGEDED